jgi:Carboxypeptidase regulatory-like domain
MRRLGRVAVVCLGLLLMGGMAVAQDSKQDKKEAQLRTVHGTVSDKSENPVPNSIVFLKNVRTNAVSSRFADSDGNYRFSGLDPNADYEVHAELDDLKSASKTVSSFESRKDIVLNLKLDRKKG